VIIICLAVDLFGLLLEFVVILGCVNRYFSLKLEEFWPLFLQIFFEPFSFLLDLRLYIYIGMLESVPEVSQALFISFSIFPFFFLNSLISIDIFSSLLILLLVQIDF